LTQDNALSVQCRRTIDERKSFDGSSLVLTASFGLDGFEGTEAQDFYRLVSRANAARYAAKRTDRKRIEIAATPVVSPRTMFVSKRKQRPRSRSRSPS
jgi:GGDEF domain-containing protein